MHLSTLMLRAPTEVIEEGSAAEVSIWHWLLAI